MMSPITTAVVGALTLIVATCELSATGPSSPATVRVTNSHLLVTCIDGRAVDGKTTSWTFSEPVSLAFTMRNEPRPGIANELPGVARVTFTPEPGHHYEIEVRSDATAYSRRVWKEGEWQPVVRDRTTNTIVSSGPTWTTKDCKA